MPRHTMSVSCVNSTPQKSGLAEQVAQAARPRSEKMDALLRRAIGPQYDATSIEAQLTEALARQGKVA